VCRCLTQQRGWEQWRGVQLDKSFLEMMVSKLYRLKSALISPNCCRSYIVTHVFILFVSVFAATRLLGSLCVGE